jgi:hypothetical protein
MAKDFLNMLMSRTESVSADAGETAAPVRIIIRPRVPQTPVTYGFPGPRRRYDVKSLSVQKNSCATLLRSLHLKVSVVANLAEHGGANCQAKSSRPENSISVTTFQ